MDEIWVENQIHILAKGLDDLAQEQRTANMIALAAVKIADRDRHHVYPLLDQIERRLV